MKTGLGFMAAIIGAAGIAGAIEQGESLVLPVIVFLIGAALIYAGEKRGGRAYKSTNHCINSNLHDYPAGLETVRRRRA